MLKGKIINNNGLFSKKDKYTPILLNNEKVLGYIETIEESEIVFSLFEKFINIYYNHKGEINHISIEENAGRGCTCRPH